MSADHGHSPEEIAERIGGPMTSNMLRDTIYGAIDGAVTTFAIVASVAGAGLSPLIVVALGLANVLADGFSMAAVRLWFNKTCAESHRAFWAPMVTRISSGLAAIPRRANV